MAHGTLLQMFSIKSQNSLSNVELSLVGAETLSSWEELMGTKAINNSTDILNNFKCESLRVKVYQCEAVL